MWNTYITFQKEIKEDNNGETCRVHGLENLILLKYQSSNWATDSIQS